MSNYVLISITSVAISFLLFYAAYDIAINEKFYIYQINDDKYFNFKNNKKKLKEKIALRYLILAILFFVVPFIISEEIFFYIYLVFLAFIAIIIFIKIIKIISKYQ